MLGVYNLVIYNCTKYQSKLNCITDYTNKKNRAEKIQPFETVHRSPNYISLFFSFLPMPKYGQVFVDILHSGRSQHYLHLNFLPNFWNIKIIDYIFFNNRAP